MRRYGNEEYLEKTIIEQSRHLFIYGHNDEYRTNFIKRMEKDYPVKIDSNLPIALYFENFGLPKVEGNPKDKYIAHSLSREYFSFLIASKLLEASKEIDESILNERLSRLIEIENKNKNSGYEDLKDVKELLEAINTSKDFYYENYINYIKGLIDGVSIEKIRLPFFQIVMFINLYKSLMNIDSHIALLFDKKREYSSTSIQMVNNLIGGRINKDISVKVFVENPDEWETYRDTNGQVIEMVHDYGDIELDDSYKLYMKQRTKY